MRKITLNRVSFNEKCTQGVLVDEKGIAICLTLENPWIDNKVRVSCIPTGLYNCEKVVSPKFGNVYEVSPVEGRSHILIHSGNIERHTKGCILLGSSFGYLRGEPAVLSSRLTLNNFHKIMNNESFYLSIKDTFM